MTHRDARAHHPKFEASHPHALAMYCSDGRFTDAVEHQLAEIGHARLDTLTIPGGPALLEMLSADSGAVMVLRNSLSFLVTAHHIKHVVLIAHQGCGYYKTRFHYETQPAIEKRQRADLRSAEKWVRAHHPDAAVITYFARVLEARVVFEQVGP